ncbi:MAG: PQQ-binding-like beta-propeller repeat protein [Opitutaceae bacterium]|nr:PQQ-binding-like beta-propeller repeat protein [Opitutaceae bacterium]
MKHPYPGPSFVSFLAVPSVAFVVLLAATATPAALAANWPSWRGPNGDGTTTTAKDLPVTWSTTQNIKWKQELPAWSGSSPMVWGERIFLNSPSKEQVQAAAPAPAPAPGARKRPGPRGPAVSGPGGQEILLLCLSRETGKELWRRQYDQGNQIQMKHNTSSPTPVSDGTNVWVVSGNGVIACFDFAGNEKWKFDLVKKFGKIGTNFGYGSSPLLLDGKLIVQVLHGMKTDEPSYIFALDAAKGGLRWRVERPTDAERETPDAYTTPSVLLTGGQKQVVISGGGYVTGHDPQTGAELWRGGGLNPRNEGNYRVISSAVVHDGMVYVPSRQAPLLAFKAGGKGDVTQSHLAWSWTARGGPDVPTPMSDGKYFYMVEDSGSITCLDAKTGKLIYGPQDTGIGRTSSSPILADGKIHVTSETAETAVIQAGPEFKLLAKNSLDGTYTLCTPAFADREIFLRTGTHLYCISNSGAK